MNSISTDFHFFIEHDSNPFILFNSDGGVKYINKSAELLLQPSTAHELYDIALTYAPKTYGVNKTIIELSISAHEFYGINVLYKDDDEIALHLYNKPVANMQRKVQLDGYTKTDLNILLQANLELFKINSDVKLSLLADYDIPKFQLHQNNVSMLLRKVLEQFNKCKKLDVILKFKLGERIIIDKKRYAIVVLEVKSIQTMKISRDIQIKEIARLNHINIHFDDKSIILEFPLIP